MLRQFHQLYQKDKEGLCRPRALMLDIIQQNKWTQHTSDYGIQSMQEYEHKFRDNISTAVSIFHHKEKGLNLPPGPIQETTNKADYRMAYGWRQNYPIHGPQRTCNKWATW